MRLWIVGAGQFGREVVDIVRSGPADRYASVAFLDDVRAAGETVHGVEVVGGTDRLESAPEDDVEVIVSVADPVHRRTLGRRVDAGGHRVATIVDPSAVVRSSAEIGPGSVVGAQVFVSCDAVLGRHCLVNVGAVIAHDAAVGDFASVNPNANVLGRVRLGDGVEVGSGASILPGVAVGAWSKVSMNSAVYKDVPENVVASGNPARVMVRKDAGWHEQE